MAYAFSAVMNIDGQILNGRKTYEISVTETECAAGEEFSISGLPHICTLVCYIADKTAGSATTLAPTGGNTTGLATGVLFAEQTAAEPIRNTAQADRVVLDLRLSSGTLYVRTTPDAGADNSVTTRMTIVSGVY